MLIAAVSRDQISAAFKITEQKALAVFATLDDRLMAKVKEMVERNMDVQVPVYFYETG